MTGVYTELENVYAGKSASPLRGGSPAEPEVGGQTEAYGRCLSPLTLPPLTGTHVRCTCSQTRCRSSEQGEACHLRPRWCQLTLLVVWVRSSLPTYSGEE